MTDPVRVVAAGPVVTMELNRPDRLNAFDAEMVGRLREAIDEVTATPAIRALVLTGAGRAFCAGADVSHLAQLQAANDAAGLRRILDEGKRIFMRLRSWPQPVVGAVNGVAAGGGCSLALAADVRVVTPEARFMQAFVRIGLHPDLGAYWSLPELVGRSRALRLMLTGEPVGAERALEWGIADELVPAEELRARAAELAGRLAEAPRLPAAFIKKGLTQGDAARFEEVLDFEIEAQVECFLSADAVEGVRAFLEKRAPAFE